MIVLTDKTKAENFQPSTFYKYFKQSQKKIELTYVIKGCDKLCEILHWLSGRLSF